MLYFSGPDQVLPSTAVRTSHPDGATRILIGEDPASKRKAVSVPTMLREAAERAPDRAALAIKREGEWVKWTYK